MNSRNRKFGPLGSLFFIWAGLAIFFAVYFPISFDQPAPKPTQSMVVVADNNKEIPPEIKEFGLEIEKINLLAPIIKEVDGNNKTTYNKALGKGVAHFRGTSLPGKGSNIFIFGHSSTFSGTGAYAEIFSRLNELEKDDKIKIYFENNEYFYTVFEKKVVQKDDLSVLEPTKNEVLTLMTCWPLHSNLKRLIIKSSLDRQ